MRILHTSDWHLGISTGPAPRVEEQRRFLDWLLATLAEREVDALVIAGDVFDSMHPSAEAQSLYYRFLAKVGGAGVRSVVVVGGNHDSPSRLDAPRALLKTVAVHVVGGVPVSEERPARMLAPLRARGSDEVAAVCVAVPYVHEYRLGIRTSGLDTQRTRAEFLREFGELYRSLVDAALERYGDVPLVATGHLTLGAGVRSEDFPQDIHQVGSIQGLPVGILDPRIRYTALGHIHRCYAVEDAAAWYCGTPIPYAMTEMAEPRHVLLVDLEGDATPSVQQIEVPRARDLVQLVGPPDEVLTDLATLSWSAPLPPLVHVRVQTQLAEPGLARRLHDAVESHGPGPGPVLVSVQQRTSEVEVAGPFPEMPPLVELTPEHVFGLMCDARKLGGDDRDQLVAAFNAIASADDETLEQMLDAIDLPPALDGGTP